VAAYGQVEAGEGLLHVDSYGQIAIAVREGRAEEAFPIAVGTTLTMRGPGTPAAELQSPSAS
jgi:S-adenosylmethionine hydrolase